MENNNVSLTISQEIVTPIVKAKVQEMVLATLGGKDDLIKQLLDKIIYSKCDLQGNVSNYNSDNKFNWLDVMVSNQVKNVIKEEITLQIKANAESIKQHVGNILKTKKGQNAVASALVDGLNETFTSGWKSSFEVKFFQDKNY